MMKLWFDELGMESWIIVVVDVWKHVVNELVIEYAIGELMMKVVVVVD